MRLLAPPDWWMRGEGRTYVRTFAFFYAPGKILQVQIEQAVLVDSPLDKYLKGRPRWVATQQSRPHGDRPSG